MVMKIGEARGIYSAQLNIYGDKKAELDKERKELAKKIKATPDGAKVYENEAAKLELSYNKVSDKYDEYREFMQQLMEMHMTYSNVENSRQQGETAKKIAEDEAKVLEVARRIAHGDKVPPNDEKKLMEYSMEIYMASKNLAMLRSQKDRKEYDSLWDDEDEKAPENANPDEVADNMELGIEKPEITEIGDLM